MGHLAKLKWPDGFKCERMWQCQILQGLQKLFSAMHQVQISGFASTELSRKLSLGQKACWLFQQKVKKAMVSSGRHPLEGNVEVDEAVVGGE